ncbi:hypothetical protein [Streptomyces bluensis]|uniref:hypothetical protein n=1 Tax=Streptomyces bluensis TaxID=33897 RepID=UPI00167C209E|nr:hypothetical protein [Streptomyces bluensis]GGZ67590.1 hypothetical protein GCM10010344_38310 [Streptomyces bluensis]
MSQPPFQQPPQPPQNPYNPYSQPASPPQQQPGYGPVPAPAPGQPPMQAGLPPAPGQPPVHPTHPGPPYQAPPFGQQPNTAGGHPVGAVLLGFLASVVVSVIYTGVIFATYKDQSETMVHTLYIGHALLNGVAVGALAGLVGGRSDGARIGAAVIAPLGAFFGYTNAVPLVIADSQTPSVVWDMLENEPFFPAKAWWGSASDTTWISLLGLVIAAAAAWGLAYATGNRGRRA